MSEVESIATIHSQLYRYTSILRILSDNREPMDLDKVYKISKEIIEICKLCSFVINQGCKKTLETAHSRLNALRPIVEEVILTSGGY
ncbi:unnamed protein product [Caenorhabditis bovis]|uniref:Uncharacterized protein n=1 Tax=Caenorhabditis bovis TaxID=2654633 RepID=A0A8S1FCM8_9PELO|nr:unnamed protein product [Caenorhabditis bovis]